MLLEIESIVIIILMSLYFNNKKEDPQCVFCDVNKSDIILKPQLVICLNNESAGLQAFKKLQALCGFCIGTHLLQILKKRGGS